MDGEANLIGWFVDDLDPNNGGVDDALAVVGAIGKGQFNERKTGARFRFCQLARQCFDCSAGCGACV